MEKVLAAFGLDTASQKLLDFADLVQNNFKYHQRANLLDVSRDWRTHLVCPCDNQPYFANDFAKALHDKQKVTLAFTTHVELHLHFGTRACFVQGLFGSGKTFATAMLSFLTACVIGQRMLWVSHNNNPLEEAAKNLAAWVDSSNLTGIRSTLPTLFRRILALKHSPKFDKVDISARCVDLVDIDRVRVMLLTTSVFADRYSQPKLVGAPFAAKADVLSFDKAQQFGSSTDAWLLSILPISTLLFFW